MYALIAEHPMLAALAVLAGLSLVFGGLLGYASVHFRVEGNPIVDQINAILPQTQCGQCGFPGCRPYAEAIAAGEAINKCPPGGQANIEALAALLDREVLTLDEEHGEEKVPHTAFIHEADCIGCTKCVQACPVDAILGAPKHMHTVIANECTGCDLCVEVCPVDCIDMQPLVASLQTWHWELPDPQSHRVDIIATDAGEAEQAA